MGAVASASVNAAKYRVGRTADVAYITTRTKLIHLGDVVGCSLLSFTVGLVAVMIARRVSRPRLRALQVLGAIVAFASTAMDLPIHSRVAAKASLAGKHILVGLAYVASLQILGSAPSGTVAGSPAVATTLELAAANLVC